jgi:hypothetical protein
MFVLRQLVAVGLCVALLAGCSEKTQTEAKEALEATGEAARAAAEDAKVNAKKAGNVLESAVEDAKEEFSDAPANGEQGNDVDAAPEPQETNP